MRESRSPSSGRSFADRATQISWSKDHHKLQSPFHADLTSIVARLRKGTLRIFRASLSLNEFLLAVAESSFQNRLSQLLKKQNGDINIFLALVDCIGQTPELGWLSGDALSFMSNFDYTIACEPPVGIAASALFILSLQKLSRKSGQLLHQVLPSDLNIDSPLDSMVKRGLTSPSKPCP
jgi:hypothetical protein